MENIVKFKNASAEKAEEKFRTEALSNLEKFKDILKNNLKLMQDDQCPEYFLITGPIYYKGNNNKEYKKIIIDSFKDVLAKALFGLESKEFDDSYFNSDVPEILNGALNPKTIGSGVPLNVAIPFNNSILTFILYQVTNGQWIVGEVFSNHKSLHQHAFEALMEKTKTNEINLFYEEE